MSEQLSLTLIAISCVIISMCVLGGTIVLFLLGRRLQELSRRVERLTEQLRASAVPVAEDLRTTVRALSQVAIVGSRLARPMLASTVFHGSLPWWARSLGVLAGLYAVSKEFFPELDLSAALRDRLANKPAANSRDHHQAGDQP